MATYGDADEIHVIRIDADASVAGRAPLHGEQIVGAAAVAPKELFGLTSPADDAAGSLRLRVVHDGELQPASSSGEGGGDADPMHPRASNGCGCSTPGGSSEGPASAALLGLLLMAARVRRRRWNGSSASASPLPVAPDPFASGFVKPGARGCGQRTRAPMSRARPTETDGARTTSRPSI